MQPMQEVALDTVALCYGVVVLALTGVIEVLKRRSVTIGPNGPVMHRNFFFAKELLSTLVRAPIGEEFAFRGFPLMICTLYGLKIALAVGVGVNVVFAAIHVWDDNMAVQENWRQRVQFAFIAGTSLLLIALGSGSLYMAVLAHFAVNAWKCRACFTGQAVKVSIKDKGEIRTQSITGWRLLPARRAN